MITPNSQAGRLLIHLQSGASIDRLHALMDLGIFELASRVLDLEKEGYIISRERKTVTNRWNEKVSVTEYRLAA